MKIVFFGTPPFSAHILDDLVQNGRDIIAVVTRPDSFSGRSQRLQPSAVKVLCMEKYPTLPIYQPEKASSGLFAATLRLLEPDVFVVAAYGEIIGQEILDIPSKLPINIHPSLLPKYRGAAPLHRAILNGDRETGVTIMEMVLKMDAGPILNVVKTPIDEETTLEELETKLCRLSRPLLLNTLDEVEQGREKRVRQDESLVTYAKKILPEDRVIDWRKPCLEIHNQIRGLSPFPGAFCQIERDRQRDGQQGGQVRRFGIKRAKKRIDLTGRPGETLAYGSGEWIVACGTGALSLLEVQIEGKNILDINSFLQGHPSPLRLKIE